MIARIFRAIEETPMTLGGWFAGFVCIVLTRTFLENFSAQRPGMLVTSDAETIVHYGLWYLLTLLLIIVALHSSIQRPIVLVSKTVLFGSLIMLTPPIMDLLISGGAPMAYLLGTEAELVRNYLTWFSASPAPGITLGIRIELAAIVLAAYAYARFAGNSIVRSSIAAVLIYTTLFFCVSLPNFTPITDTIGWLVEADTSLIGTSGFRVDQEFASISRSYDMHFNIAMSQVIYLLLTVIVSFVLFRISPRKWIAIVRNSRPERVLHYSCMLALGIALAYVTGSSMHALVSFFDLSTLIMLFVSFYFAWMFAVSTNDIVDRDADALTNTSRPLITGVLTETDMRTASGIFLGASLTAGFLAGHAALFFVIVFISVYSMYSLSPLRLKRFVGINSFCIALATLSAVSAGFFTVSAAPVSAFPLPWIALILIVFTLIANIKDLKDTDGDRLAKVYTIPVIFGDARGRTIIWGMVALALLLVPFILTDMRLLVPGIIASACAHPLIHRNPFRELHLFLLYFAYLFSLALVLLFS